MLKRKREDKVKPKHALQEAIGFMVEDLEINDSGGLSPSQRQTLKRDFKSSFLLNIALIGLYVLAYDAYQSGTKPLTTCKRPASYV